MKLTAEQKLYQQVVQMAWDDADFKKSLIANPSETIEKIAGKKINLPQGKKLVVIEESQAKDNKPEDDKLYIIIPEAKKGDFQLTEEELEMVAGGVEDAGLSVQLHFDKDFNYTGCTWDFTI